MSEEFAIVHYESLDGDRFPESGVEHWKLTEALGATETRVNVVRLEPGQSLSAHRHDRQEELYVTPTGGQVRIEDETHVVPAEGVVRMGPDCIRKVTNETTEETHVWVMIGAPPVGTVEDFGEYRMPGEG
jgi:quercetin dioxygenase-like cupin family protein